MAVVVEQHRAVHLARQPDGIDPIAGQAARRQRAANRLLTRAPPVGWVLLGPRGLRRRERRVRRRLRREQAARLVDDDGA
jgi:hypothetical protein